MIFSPADFLLWTRCRRQWLRSAFDGDRRFGVLPREMTGEANLRETARVIELGVASHSPASLDAAAATLREADGPPIAAVSHLVLDEERVLDWADRTSTHIAERESLRHALFVWEGSAVVLDLMQWHPRLEGWRATLFRPGTGLRGVYSTEAALAALVLARVGIPLAELEIAFLDKGWRVEDGAAFDGLFRGSNLVRRAQKRVRFVEDELRDLREAAVEQQIPGEYRCSQGCSLCAPRHAGNGDEDERYSVYTLHKGAQLARELSREGISSLRDVDITARRISAKQRIQIEAVLADQLYVNRERLRRFLDRIVFPIFFLDFEAYAPSVPPFSGLAPYEHVPVIASVHTRYDGVEKIDHESFISPAGSDARQELYTWLTNLLGTEGSIVVFSKGFESAMVRQMARNADAEAEGERLVERMVDLLEPFSEFAVYHPEQRGKVSLKRVLPALTEAHYGESPLTDGMHANLAYTRQADLALVSSGSMGEVRGAATAGADTLSGPIAEASPFLKAAAAAAERVSAVIDSHGRAPSARAVTVEEIATYCGVDTIAMVHLVRRLEELLSDSGDPTQTDRLFPSDTSQR